jgi:hypothetical protein
MENEKCYKISIVKPQRKSSFRRRKRISKNGTEMNLKLSVRMWNGFNWLRLSYTILGIRCNSNFYTEMHVYLYSTYKQQNNLMDRCTRVK